MDQAAWDERYAGPELVWGAGPNCFVATELAGLSPGRALDLGTGEGRNAIWLAERGWQVTGVDFSAVGLGRAAVLARQRGVGVDWVQADLLSYAPAPGGYDLVLIAYIQLPPAELAHLVRAAAAAVAPGGTLLAVGHDSDNLTRGWGGPQYPDVLWTPQAVAAGLDGLTCTARNRSSGMCRRPTASGWPSTRWCAPNAPPERSGAAVGRARGIDTAAGDRGGWLPSRLTGQRTLVRSCGSGGDGRGTGRTVEAGARGGG